MPRVLATGFLVGLFEMACIKAVNPHIDWPREQSVGIAIDITHLAPTPPAMTVTIKGTLEAVKGRKLTFSLTAHDGVEKISEGTHARYIIDKAAFDDTVKKKTP
jgi:fluoroacetyl-CoA thioesterase